MNNETKKHITTTKYKWFKLKPLARANRNELTFAEKQIWNFIRKNQLGVKFRRQQAIANFIVDFVNLDFNLIIEIDGSSHDEKQEYDEYRQKCLEELGYYVLRFKNDEVIENGNKAEEIIRETIAMLKSRKAITPPQPSP